MNMFIRSSRDPEKKANNPPVYNHCPKPQTFWKSSLHKKHSHQRSNLFKLSQRKWQEQNQRTLAKQAYSRHLPLNYVYVTTRTQRYMWATVDTVRMAK